MAKATFGANTFAAQSFACGTLRGLAVAPPAGGGGSGGIAKPVRYPLRAPTWTPWNLPTPAESPKPKKLRWMAVAGVAPFVGAASIVFKHAPAPPVAPEQPRRTVEPTPEPIGAMPRIEAGPVLLEPMRFAAISAPAAVSGVRMLRAGLRFFDIEAARRDDEWIMQALMMADALRGG